jgi:hypothetical protein
MSDKTGPYHVIDFPQERRDMPAINELTARKHL